MTMRYLTRSQYVAWRGLRLVLAFFAALAFWVVFLSLLQGFQ